MDGRKEYGSHGMEAEGQDRLQRREYEKMVLLQRIVSRATRDLRVLKRADKTLTSFAAFWALALGLLVVAICSAKKVSGVPLSFQYMRSLGLGRPFVDNAVSQSWYQTTPSANLGSLTVRVLAANLPQFLLSLVYMSYNDLFTRMQLAQEWLSYSRTRKSLRVTNPEGEQRSTRFLQLPFTHAVPLLISTTILHWLVSQSVFVVLANTYDYSNGGSPQDEGLNVIGVGWSPYGVILTLIVGGALILGLWLYAFLLRYPRGMPLAGTCSAAISAACHRPQWDGDAARKKVMWGVVSEDTAADIIGHVAFSSGDVRDPTPGNTYAGRAAMVVPIIGCAAVHLTARSVL